MLYREMNEDQHRIFFDTQKLFDTYKDLYHKELSYKGGMHWKKIKGRQYLFRTRDRYGNGKSLGRRGPETEEIIKEFQESKKDLKEQISEIKKRLNVHARFCRAARIQRVPRIVTGIVRILDQQNMLGKNMHVIGTNAMYAYEASAGVLFENQILMLKDKDVSSRLTLVIDRETEDSDLISIFKKVDRSFEPAGAFKAVNKNGYVVDLVKPEPKYIFSRAMNIDEKYDERAAETQNLQWLISSPKFTQIVIGDDGYPALLKVPDPRAFALHKLWLSKQHDRDPLKKQRDIEQAIAVLNLVVQYLPEYTFDDTELRMFPEDVVMAAQEKIKEIDLLVF